MIRAIILSATAAALICLWLDQPTPVKASNVPYCSVNYKIAFKDKFGGYKAYWANGFGPCYLQDEYRNI